MEIIRDEVYKVYVATVSASTPKSEIDEYISQQRKTGWDHLDTGGPWYGFDGEGEIIQMRFSKDV